MLIVPSAGGDFGNTFVEQSNGLITLREPMLGEHLDAATVPDVLRNWPILKDGYDFLAAEGQRVDFSLLLTHHGRGEQLAEAGIDLRAEASQVRAARGILFLEAVHRAEENGRLTRAFNEVSQGRESPARHRPYLTDSGGTFLADVLELIHNTEARIEFPDISKDRTSAVMSIVGPMHALAAQWYAAYKQTVPKDVTPQTSKEALALGAGAQHFREFLIIGMIGVVLSRGGYLLGPEEPIVGRLVMGAGHSFVAQKMDALTHNTTRILGECEIGEATSILRRGIGRAALTTPDIAQYHQLRLANPGEDLLV